MICEICHKNEATIHMQEIHGDEKKTLDICSECAASNKIAGSDLEGLNLAEILYNLSSQMLAGQKPDVAGTDHPSLEVETPFPLSCRCGWNTEKFRETGRLGCAECYVVFFPLLRDAIVSMHKGDRHLGKVPVNFSGTETSGILGKRNLVFELATLESRLDEYVKNEEYEKAAEARDEIRALESEIRREMDAGKRKGNGGKKSG